MRRCTLLTGSTAFLALINGCATYHHSASTSLTVTRTRANELELIQAGYQSPAPVTEPSTHPILSKDQLELEDLVTLALERHPRLEQATWAIDAARGQVIQAGLYPNPTTNVTGNELGDRTGPGGIWSVITSQEIVTANKLGLSQSVAQKEVDEAELHLLIERYRLLTEVRLNYFDVIALERRRVVLTELIQLAEKAVDQATRLLRAKEGSQLDLVQLELFRDRYKADLQAVQRELPALKQRLLAVVGIRTMHEIKVTGGLENAVPDYDYEKLKAAVLANHPELRSAQVAIERAQFQLLRAESEATPNVSIGAGYTRQNQNLSNDWDIGVSVPLPLWNRNQGNVHSAKAKVAEASAQLGRVENELTSRLATAFASYAAARTRTEQLQKTLIPKANETYQLSITAYDKGGQLEYLRVIEAQRSLAESKLELIRTQAEMWRAVSELAGLALEEQVAGFSFGTKPEGERK